MSLLPRTPFGELESLFDRYQRELGKMTGHEVMTSADWSPAVDITETKTEYLIKVELPEVKREDIKVAVENGVLTLSGERHIEKEDKDKKHHRIERYYGRFARSFTLPDDTDPHSIDADYKDGVLTLRLKKVKKAQDNKVLIDIK